ncbi:mitochondrial carrier [Atractiella rhizophila]|nr:mitochondrial carrier [Atractiella rhizophila]
MTASSTSPFSHALLAGSFSGLTVDLLFFPIDTLKTRIQSPNGFLASGGFKGVYRGVGSIGVGSAPGAAAFFSVYTFFNRTLPRLGVREGTATHMLASSIGEVAACLIRVPTEVVKQRSQAGVYGTETKGSWRTLWRVFGDEGFRGLYRGFGITVFREIPFSCIQFPLYEHFKLRFSSSFSPSGSKEPSFAQIAISASLSGSIAGLLTTPLDVIKTRVMLDVPSMEKKKANPMEMAGRIWRTEGWRTFWKGGGTRALWLAGGGTVFLGTFEFFTSLLR